MAAVPSIGRATGVSPPSVAREADATRALYERYHHQLYSFCLHQLGNREEAEDAVQGTFLNAFRGLKRGIEPQHESAWLFKIAANVCLTRRRASYRRGRVESATDMQEFQDVIPGTPRQADELWGLNDALAAMPEQQRTAILLREWQGLSYKEIAEEMALSQGAVETLIFRARRTLAQGLEQPETKRGKLRRLRHAIDFGGVLAGLKTFLGTGAAVKVAATVAVATTATSTVVATQTHVLQHKPKRAPKPVPAQVQKEQPLPVQATHARTGSTVVRVPVTSGSDPVVVARTKTAATKAPLAAEHDAAPLFAPARHRSRAPIVPDVETPVATPPVPVPTAAVSEPATESTPVTDTPRQPEQPKQETPAQPKSEPKVEQPRGEQKKDQKNEHKAEQPKTTVRPAEAAKTEAPKSAPKEEQQQQASAPTRAGSEGNASDKSEKSDTTSSTGSTSSSNGNAAASGKVETKSADPPQAAPPAAAPADSGTKSAKSSDDKSSKREEQQERRDDRKVDNQTQPPPVPAAPPAAAAAVPPSVTVTVTQPASAPPPPAAPAPPAPPVAAAQPPPAAPAEPPRSNEVNRGEDRGHRHKGK